jgi:tetratricopeptide (TPR) repeat protein
VTARRLVEEGVALFREVGDRWGLALTVRRLGEFHDGPDAMRSFQEESLQLFHEIGDKWGMAIALSGLGQMAQKQGDYVIARSLFEEALAARRELNHKFALAGSLLDLGRLAQCQGNHTQAVAHYQESLSLFQEIGNWNNAVGCLRRLAGVASAQGQLKRAARLFAVVSVVCERVDARSELECEVGAVRDALGEEAFTTAWAAGRAMTLDQAAVYALQASAEG